MANRETARPQGKTLIHSTFQVERTYPQSPNRVFRAFAEKEVVRKWRVEDENCRVHEFTFDFRVGGLECSRFTFDGGPEIRLDAQFQDIVPNERIVFSYRMAIGEMPLSVSLASVELIQTPSGGTDLTHTEYGIYFDEADAADHRKEGCQFLLEKLGKALEEELQ
jgi:uncharacterized protein YndB with AHSA1/START domain